VGVTYFSIKTAGLSIYNEPYCLASLVKLIMLRPSQIMTMAAGFGLT
jgi:hypothetical protein